MILRYVVVMLTLTCHSGQWQVIQALKLNHLPNIGDQWQAVKIHLVPTLH